MSFGYIGTRTQWAVGADAIGYKYNVKSHGAAGNGVRDDYANIQRLIDRVYNRYQNTGIGGVVFFPPGTYVCSETLECFSGVHLVGSGRKVSVIQSDADIERNAIQYGRSVYTEQTPLQAANWSARHFTVHKTNWDPRSIDPPGSGTFTIAYADRFLIFDVEAYHSASCGIMVIGDNTDGEVLACFAHDCQAAGISMYEGATRIRVAHNNCYYTGDDGLDCNSYEGFGQNTDCVIENNIIRDTGGTGITCWGGIRNILRHNKVINTRLCGIVVRGYPGFLASEGTVVEGNYIHGSSSENDTNMDDSEFAAGGTAAAILVESSTGIRVKDFTIRNNRIFHPGYNGVAVLSTNGGGQPIANGVIEGNEIYGPFDYHTTTEGSRYAPNAADQSGIYIANTEGIIIHNNKIIQPTHAGISIKNTVNGRVRITGNTIAQHGQRSDPLSGIVVDAASAAQVTAYGNDVFPNHGEAAITISGGVTLNNSLNFPSAVSGTLRANDNCQRADGALGTTSGGQTWTNVSGSHQIRSLAIGPGYSAGVTHLDTLPTGVNDYAIFADILPSSTSNRIYTSLVLKYNDSNNYIIVAAAKCIAATGVVLYTVVGGSATLRGTGSSTPVEGEQFTLQAQIVGSAVKVYYNGNLEISYTLSGGEAAALTAQTVGIRSYTNTDGDDAASRYRRLTVRAAS